MSFALGAACLALADRSLLAYAMGLLFVLIPFNKNATTGRLFLLLAVTMALFVAYFFYAAPPRMTVGAVASVSEPISSLQSVPEQHSSQQAALPASKLPGAPAIDAAGATQRSRSSGPFHDRWFGILALIVIAAVWLPSVPLCVAFVALARLALRTLQNPRTLGARILASAALLALIGLCAWTWLLVPTPCDVWQNPASWPPKISLDLDKSTQSCDPNPSPTLQYLAPATAPVVAICILPVLTFLALSAYLAAAPLAARLLYSLHRHRVLGNRRLMIGLGSALIVAAFAPQRIHHLVTDLLKEWGVGFGSD